MGICGSNANKYRDRDDEEQESRAIDKQIIQDYRQDEMVAKLLLLGTGESGKSTVFKQMVSIYGQGEFPTNSFGDDMG